MVGPRSHGPRCRSTRPGITLLGRPLAANGRCSDGMSTPAARRDQDARSARRLGYVNTCRLGLMKQIPNGTYGRGPGPAGRRPAEKRHGRRPHLWPPGGHSNSHNLAASNLHCNGLRPNSQKLEAVNLHNHEKHGPGGLFKLCLCIPRPPGTTNRSNLGHTRKAFLAETFYDLRCHGIFAAVAS